MYATCDGDQMKWVCTNPICLSNGNVVRLDCYKCIISSHEHKPYIKEYETIDTLSQKKGIGINLRLEQQKNQTEKCQRDIQIKLKKVSDGCLSIIKKIENYLLSQLQGNLFKISGAQARLVEIIKDDNNKFLKEKICFATSEDENILPNIDNIGFKVSEIDPVLDEILTSIIGLDTKVNSLAQQQLLQEEIKLYNIQSYECCHEHNNELKKYICTQCLDMKQLCQMCIQQKHQNHNIETEVNYTFKIKQSLEETKRNQKSQWSQFFKVNSKKLNEDLHKHIEKNMEGKFNSLFEEQTKSSLKSSIVKSNISTLQNKIQNKLGAQFNILIRSCSEIIQGFKYDEVEVNNFENTVKIQYQKIKIKPKFTKDDLTSLIKEGTQYLLIFSNKFYQDEVFKKIEDLSLIEITLTIRLQKCNFKGLYEKNDELMLFGSKGNFVNLQFIGLYYSIVEIFVNDQKEIRNSKEYDYWYLLEEKQILK